MNTRGRVLCFACAASLLCCRRQPGPTPAQARRADAAPRYDASALPAPRDAAVLVDSGAHDADASALPAVADAGTALTPGVDGGPPTLALRRGFAPEPYVFTWALDPGPPLSSPVPCAARQGVHGPVLLLDLGEGLPALFFGVFAHADVRLVVQRHRDELDDCPVGEYDDPPVETTLPAGSRGVFDVFVAYPEGASVSASLAIATRHSRATVAPPPAPPPAADEVRVQWSARGFEESQGGCTNPVGCTQLTLSLEGAMRAEFEMPLQDEPATCGAEGLGVGCSLPADHGGYSFALVPLRGGQYAVRMSTSSGLEGGTSRQVVRRFTVAPGLRLVRSPLGLR